MDTTNYFLCLAAFFAAAFLFAEFALGFGNAFFLLAEKARVLHKLAVGQRGELGEPNINTNSLLRRRQRLLLYLHRKADVPFVALSPDRAGFYPSFHRAVHNRLDVAYLGQVDRLLPCLETCLRIGETVIPFALKARKTGRIAALHPRKERLERKINADSDILQDLTEHAPDFRELFRPYRKVFLLFITRRRRALHFIVVLAFVEQAVVYITAHVQSATKSRILSGCREQSVL